MGEPVQALCFLAGTNSIFYGDKLLVTGNPDVQADVQLLRKLGLRGKRTQGSNTGSGSCVLEVAAEAACSERALESQGA